MNKKTLFFSIIGLLFGLSLLFFPKNSSTFDDKSEKLYLQGMEFVEKLDFQNAYYNFGKINRFSSLYPLAIYRQGLCADELSDNNTSIKKYKRFIKLVPDDEIFTPASMWQLAEAYKRNDDIGSARAIYKKITKKYEYTDFARASEYRLAELANENNKELKKRYYVKYLHDAPIGRFSSLAIEELKKYDLNSKDKVVVANSYFEKGEFDSALSILENIEDNDAYFLKGKIYFKKNNKQEARSYFYKYLKTLNSEEGENINLAVDSFVKTYKNFVLAYEDLIKIENPYTILGIYFNYAQDLNNQKSASLYDKIIKLNPQSYFAPEAMWELFWRAYKTKNYKLALKYVDSHSAMYKNKNSSPKILYFAGKIHINLRHKKTANKYFNRIIEEYPDSYYAYRASERLANIINQFSKLPNKKLNFDKKVFIKTNSNLLDFLITLDDIEAINSLKLKDEIARSYIAYKRGNRSYSIVLARDEIANTYPKPEKYSPSWLLAYPIYYKNEIINSASNYKYNPALILAIIKEESFFNSRARSSAGAMGLMQLMPATASSVLGRKVTSNDLYNPDLNIRIGVKYISSLRQDFNNEMLAIASYNAGLGNVKKWKSKIFNGDYDDFVEEIPFLETKMYVKKVFASFWNYRRLY